MGTSRWRRGKSGLISGIGEFGGLVMGFLFGVSLGAHIEFSLRDFPFAAGVGVEQSDSRSMGKGSASAPDGRKLYVWSSKILDEDGDEDEEEEPSLKISWVSPVLAKFKSSSRKLRVGSKSNPLLSRV